MKVTSNDNQSSYFRKLRTRIEAVGQAREFTFTCYNYYKFLNSDRTRTWFIEELDAARNEFKFDL